MKFLIAGLGNIGDTYKNTRHNIGFDICDLINQKLEGNFELGRHAFVSETRHKGKTLILIKPTTYMNLSGKAVHYWLQAEKIKTEHLLVVTDDIALPYGKMRLKPKGSDGGHNGLKHINQVLESTEYPRLRFGIGNQFAKGHQADYVLGHWNTEELKDLELHKIKALDAVFSFCQMGIEKTMSIYNA
jgi:PTH1 family peptidyl-tRNA hydrolase